MLDLDSLSCDFFAEDGVLDDLELESSFVRLVELELPVLLLLPLVLELLLLPLEYFSELPDSRRGSELDLEDSLLLDRSLLLELLSCDEDEDEEVLSLLLSL